MQVNKFLPVAIIYFFLNSVGLPFGLTYTSLLAPLFYIWIIAVRKKEILIPFIAVLAPFIIIHFAIVGVETNSYLISLLNLLLVYVFCQAVYTFLRVCRDLEKIFRQVLVINFILCIVAIPVYFTPFYEVLWIEQNVSKGLMNFRRLKLLTYEPSFYALLFIPVFFFFLLQYMFRKNNIQGGLLLAMIFLPIILSFSMGVMASAILSGIIVWVIYFRRLTRKRRIFNALIYSAVTLMSGLFVLVFFFRNNPLFLRLQNILLGSDTSARGRTDEAFVLAQKITEEGNAYWGVGMGQIKIIAGDLIRKYYQYEPGVPVAIPNAAAETLAIFGWTGFTVRFFIEIFFFLYTRVWNNYYRLLLFFFVFIYQFTGSFITNAAEYVIWILAFTNVFKEFNVVQSPSVIKLPQPLQEK